MAPRAYKSYYRKVFSLEAFRVLFYVAGKLTVHNIIDTR